MDSLNNLRSLYGIPGEYQTGPTSGIDGGSLGKNKPGKWNISSLGRNIRDGFKKSANYVWDASKRIPRFARAMRSTGVAGSNTDRLGQVFETMAGIRILMGMSDLGEGIKDKDLGKVLNGSKEVAFGACFFNALIKHIPVLGPVGAGAYIGLCGHSMKEGMSKPGIKDEVSSLGWGMAGVAWLLPYVSGAPGAVAAAAKIGIAGCATAAGVDLTRYTKSYVEKNQEKKVQALDNFMVSLGWMFSFTGNPILAGTFIAAGLIPRILYNTSPKSRKLMDRVLRGFERITTDKILGNRKKENMGQVAKTLIMDEGNLIEKQIDPFNKKVFNKLDKVENFVKGRLNKASSAVAGHFSDLFTLSPDEAGKKTEPAEKEVKESGGTPWGLKNAFSKMGNIGKTGIGALYGAVLASPASLLTGALWGPAGALIPAVVAGGVAGIKINRSLRKQKKNRQFNQSLIHHLKKDLHEDQIRQISPDLIKGLTDHFSGKYRKNSEFENISRDEFKEGVSDYLENLLDLKKPEPSGQNQK